MARRDTSRTRVRAVVAAVLAVLSSSAMVADAGAAPPAVPTTEPVAPAAPVAAPPEPVVTVTQAPAPTAAVPTTAAAPTTTAAAPETTRASSGGSSQTPTPTTSRPPATTPRTTDAPRAGGPTTTERTRDAGTTVSLPPPSTSEPAPQTLCTSVVHIGDSLSVGLDSAGYVGSKEARISVRYAAVGVRTLRLESSGGRSVIEHLDGQEDGEVVAKRIRRSGFHGCWVIALGTNDAANVAHGSGYGYSERIDRMMAVIGDDPVLWVDAKTTRRSGDYAAANMRLFNQALAKAYARYPGLKVYAWSDAAPDDWFQRDGIHYSQGGAAYRAALIAAALAEAFPAD